MAKTFYIQSETTIGHHLNFSVRVHDSSGFLAKACRFNEKKGGFSMDVDTEPQAHVIYQREVHLSRKDNHLILKEGPRFLDLGDAHVTVKTFLIDHLIRFMTRK